MIFTQITQAEADPILGLTEAFKADPRTNKINLGVGIYKTETGETPVLQSVKKAEACLLAQEKTKNYLGIEGVSAYNAAVLPLLFGADSELVKSGRAAVAQAPGGTGALRIASEFVMRNTQSRTVWISNPTWVNHRNVFETAGLTVKEYRYYHPENHALDFDAMMTDLKTAQAGDLVLLHGCCHNPTGIDPTLEQWQKIGELCRDKALVPLFDFAYQGFGKGLEQDAAGLRLVASMVPELLIASSFSKNFGLYNERVGAVTLVAADSDTCKRAFSQMKRVIRANYSNPPAHGALVVSTILNDAELRQEWEMELTQMRERIATMRTLFVDSLKAQGVKQDFSFISHQCGMFSFSGLDQAQVTRLKDEFGVYIVGSGRISVAGMTHTNMPSVCQAIAAVLKN